MKNIYVLGLNDFNRRKLEALPRAGDYRFHGLLSASEIIEADAFPVDEMLERAEHQLRAAAEPPDAIVGYMDFPVSTLQPLLARRMGLSALSIEAMLKCEHKYWSRCEQKKVIPEAIPDFQLVDPFAEAPLEHLPMGFPFWLKPVKSAGSYLGFRIENETDFNQAISEIREHIHRFAEPFDRILDHVDLPPEIAQVGGHYCLAEQLLVGDMCTLEGYVHNGAAHVHGVVDSVRELNTSSFASYQYPSRMPREVQDRMAELATRVLRQIGFDRSAFNIEFFWDRSRDEISLLEINTRIAQHHSDLFQKVHGVSNHHVAVEVALGQDPHLPEGAGAFNCAGAFWLRMHDDAWVADVPSEQDLAEVAETWPGTWVELEVGPGMWLSELHDQDSYSYVVALIYVGAEDHQALERRYAAVVERLHFDLRSEPVAALPGAGS